MRELIYYIPPDQHHGDSLRKIFSDHPEIQYVSLMGVDLLGNDTDEKIPIRLFIEDIEGFLTGGVQTDGSSVALHGIAHLNDARVDLVPDLSVNWFVDYNYYHMENQLPVGTLRISAFLIHKNKRVDSRAILQNTVTHFTDTLTALLKEHPQALRSVGIQNPDEIESIRLTVGTELEFWVQRPDEEANVTELAASQTLKEQYWKRTTGIVRTALEKTIALLDKYNMNPEMGHKEVGGVQSKIEASGETRHVLEQLEIDWKYSEALQAADNEIMAREIISDVFRSSGLEVTFAAKPIEGVSGSGEHTHVGVVAKLKSGKVKNLFSPAEMEKSYLSIIGYGALMGILKNYEVINPFITHTNDAFNRLKPGFEAPVCIVTALGHTVHIPSRNRSVLVGLIRDIENPKATRFEVRSPNPQSNTYLVIATLYQAMLDGITAAVKSGYDEAILEQEISKEAGKGSFYLEKERKYRSEEDVFEYYTQEERNLFFGIPPATVWENMKNLDCYLDKRAVLTKGDVFTEAVIDAFKAAALSQWGTELLHRIIPNNMKILRSCVKRHKDHLCTDLDIALWEKINSIRHGLMKDSFSEKSLFSDIREALKNREYDRASELQLEMGERMKVLKGLYEDYKRNMLDTDC